MTKVDSYGAKARLQLPFEVCSLVDTDPKPRRWNVISSGLLIGTLALIVTFTGRSAFLSATAIVVVAAIGLIALLLQLRFRYRDLARVRAPMWLNIVAILFALPAFFADRLKFRAGLAELFALLAILCFGISGGVVLHELRKRRITPELGPPPATREVPPN